MSTKIASLYAELGAQDKLTPSLQDAKTQLTGFGGALKSGIGQLVGLTSAVAIGGMAIRAFTDFIKGSVKAAAEAETGMARLNATLIATGRGSEISSKQIDQAAVSLMKISTFDDEAIVGAYNTLLKFESIPTENIESIVKTSMDMSAAMGGDLTSNADMLGRALETGVIPRTWGFSAALKEQFAAQVKAGDSAKALTLMMDELNKRYGGQATAQLNTYAGSTDRLKNAWGELLEAAGTNKLSGLEKINNLLADGIIKQTEYTRRAEEMARAHGMLQGAIKYTDKGERDLIETTEAGIEALKDFGDQYKAISSYGKQYTDTLESQADKLKTYSTNIEYFTWLHRDGVTYIKQLEDKLKDIRGEFGKNSEEYEKANKWLEQTKLNYLGSAGAIEYNKEKLGELGTAAKRQADEWMLNTLTQKLSVDGLSSTEMAFLLQYQVDTGLLSADAAQRAQDAWDMSEKITAAVNAMPGAKYIDIWYQVHGYGAFAGVSNTPTGGGGKTTHGGKSGEQMAAGGQLGSDWSEVGEEGSEGVSPSGMVVPHTQWEYMKRHGLIPGRHFAKDSGGGGANTSLGYLQSQMPIVGTNDPYAKWGGAGGYGPAGFQTGWQEGQGASGGGSGAVIQAVSATVSATRSVSSAAANISASGEKTAQATQQNTAQNNAGNMAIVTRLESIENLLERNFQQMPKDWAAAQARSVPA